MDFRHPNRPKFNQKVNPTTQQPRYRKNIKFSNSSTLFTDFSYFALGMLRYIFNKNGAKIPSKTNVKSTPQLASILVPTWLHFGRVLGAKLEPSWHQIASKADPKNDTKNDHLLDRPNIDIWSILPTR